MQGEEILFERGIATADDLLAALKALDIDHNAPMYIYLPGSSETVSGLQVVEVRLTDGSMVRNLRLLR